MSNLKPPVEVNLQVLDAQELLEWRDLQNAQLESLKHVWDNPEDDCWNDVPSNQNLTMVLKRLA
ncbi:MAG: hypothetical protein AUJ20_08435 [Comamonadaceae bacterium CG1_02_60_18]|nr:MAG: hypothetical protein AUJ20_08435 [Comamonadaceae bacterium CG1_02_60_18]PIQ53629.1 MAG: hypothetical protein COW02_06280 [Comamonadaceae bacterium CG12_big_fil_rev_8_21_14_0_65_59_15]